MKLRKLMLGTAALAGTLFFASGAFADPNVYNTNPTPAERAATEQLNRDAAARAHDDAAAAATANDNNNAARTDYNRNMQNYDTQRAGYERDRARYDRENDRSAHRWEAFYGHDSFRDLSAMHGRELIGLTVRTRGGDRIGRIRDVDGRGAVTRVSVELRHNRSAWIDVDDLRYDPRGRGVVTDLSRDQVDHMANMHYPRF